MCRADVDGLLIVPPCLDTLRWHEKERGFDFTRVKAAQSHLKATPKPVDSQPIATPRPPQSYPKAPPKPPQSHPKAKAENRKQKVEMRPKPGTCEVHRKYKPGASQVQARYMRDTCVVHAWYMHGTCEVQATYEPLQGQGKANGNSRGPSVSKDCRLAGLGTFSALSVCDCRGQAICPCPVPDYQYGTPKLGSLRMMIGSLSFTG